ncbi:hypothetical protein LSAT2_020657 [Lamellibrachia satsuma]|nr:hypothetical protein LSAT2_020657 [Lamellibrachia satsuma]
MHLLKRTQSVFAHPREHLVESKLIQNENHRVSRSVNGGLSSDPMRDCDAVQRPVRDSESGLRQGVRDIRLGLWRNNAKCSGGDGGGQE